jgi:hypothetical protein
MRIQVLAFLLFLSAITFAQSPSKVISQANKALGGEKALKAVSSWQQAGKITRVSDGAAGNYSAYAASGGLFGGLFDVSGFEVGFGYNGKSGWVRDSKNGLRTVTGDASRDFQAEAGYRATRWLRAKDEKTKISAGGTASVSGKPANVVLLTTVKGSRIKLYFDAATGLLLRDETEIGDVVKAYEYGDYRRVGSVLTPFEIKYSEGDEKYDIRLDDVRFNQQIARSAFDFPVISNEPLPDIPALLDEVRANADKVDAILENYSFTEERIERDLKDNGQLVVKESEKTLLTFYKGYRIKRTLEKNGKPLSPSDQAKEDKDVEKQVAEIEKKIADKEKKAEKMASGSVGQPKDEGNRRITIAEALKGSLLVNPRRERFRGRDVIVFDYEPNPKFKPKSRMEQLFALCNGAVWVDTTSKQIVRLEATLSKGIGNFLAKASRGASFTLENDLVNNEIWLPSQADINLQIKLFLIAGININNLVKYGDYRRFSTEVKDATVDGDKKP